MIFPLMTTAIFLWRIRKNGYSPSDGPFHESDRRRPTACHITDKTDSFRSVPHAGVCVTVVIEYTLMPWGRISMMTPAGKLPNTSTH